MLPDMRINKLFYTILIITIFHGCAKQTSPTGGPKDETPPSLLKSSPDHGQTNFKGNTLELTFDELIQLNNPREQLLITPALQKKVDAVAKKNKVIVTFNEKLQENTTYNINFRESIQDLNERNPTQAKLAFSTGEYIDSLSISGTVKDHLLDIPNKGFTVALTYASDTFNIFKHKALWLTQTSKEGNFSIENLKPGNYFIYAFDDKNKNLTVDSKSERYGVIYENISLQQKIDSVNITTYKLDASNFKVITARPTFNYFLIRFSKGVSDFDIINSGSSDKLYKSIEPDNASIKIYNTFPITDSLQIQIKGIDSLQNTCDTLIYLKFNKKESTKDKFSHKLESNTLSETNSLLTTVLTFSKPILLLQADSIYINLDSTTVIRYTNTDASWNNTLTKLTLQKKIEINKTENNSTLNEKQQPKPNQSDAKKITAEANSKQAAQTKKQITLPKGTFISVEGDTLSLISEAYKIIRIEDTGTLAVKVECNENFIIQLIDRSGKVAAQSLNTKTHTFFNLPPDTYSLRLIIDKNKNGIWDAGNPFKKENPEPVVFYLNPKKDKQINLKANWEVGPLLITYP